MITVTPAAAGHVLRVLTENGASFLRIAVHGGGCAGFSYVFSLAESTAGGDHTITATVSGEEARILVDSISADYLKGCTLDYREGLAGSGFVIINPNATGTCGCGQSFSR